MSDAATGTSAYVNPLIERYASKDMSFVFSPDFKFSTWRKLWVALAESESELGLPVSREQIEEMKQHVSDIDYIKAAEHENRTRHDVMAHVLTYGEACPKAKPIIHLGATSAYVGDNTDLVQIREALVILVKRLGALISCLRKFSLDHRKTATLGFTHYQPAQLTTIGKRASLWLLDLCLDFQDLTSFLADLPFRGVKGTTGTQASYLSLFEGDHEKVKQLDRMISERMGFAKILPVTGQTYTRKLDAKVGAILSGLAQSLHKMANDIRLLQNLKEIEEPFGSKQIGSSAMAYKRNPMRSERMTSLSRFVITLAQSPAMTAAEQWFERTLDDSANKRLAIPQAFLAADACLLLGLNICGGLVVYPKAIAKHIAEELPFMATESILMEAVKRGGDRQSLHEKIRQHSHDAAAEVKLEGKPNDLLDRICADKDFGLSREEVEGIIDVRKFIGRAPEQVAEFVAEHVDPLLEEAAKFGTAQDVGVRV